MAKMSQNTQQQQQIKENTVRAFGGSSGPIRTGTVQNKQAAPIQITAEQILREAHERREEAPKLKKQEEDIRDLEELEEFRLRKRKEFEDRIRRNDRGLLGVYIRYANWEESQKQFDRARSIFERALDLDHRDPDLWIKYAEMEARNKFINFARNVYNRAVTLLPRVDKLWYKYTYMEQVLGQIAEARKIFERWMQWQPEEPAWKAYIKMEVRHKEYDRARLILRRFVHVHPYSSSWIYFAKFEMKLNNIENARKVFEAALKALDDRATEDLFVAFAKFEEENREIERARAIYKYALDHVPKHRAKDLFTQFANFEKQFGDREGIEDVIISQRRFQYEEELKNTGGHNYEIWFDYIKLEEEVGKIDRIREVYERAIANIPPVKEKRYWRRYIYLWINYALFEELIAKDVDRTRDVYKACLQTIPHKEFSFSKMWILFAKFEIRQKNISAARMILGKAIGLAPKDKLFNEYIKIEIRLGNVDRARKIFEKQLEYNSSNCNAWKNYAELEHKLGEIQRARSIYELAVEQPVLDMPELIWKAYIDFEIVLKNYDLVRKLYERLLAKTKHVKVWLSYILFETSINEIDRARDLFQRAYKYLKTAGSLEEESTSTVESANIDQELERKEQRFILVKNWKEFEETHGNKETLEQVQSKMPKQIKKKRKVTTENGEVLAGWEEYVDYVFPDDEKTSAATSLKILEAAKKWKRQMQQQ